MPRYDKTGPEGKGPKTGRGIGKCKPKKKTKRKAPVITKETAMKIIKNPKTPKGLKEYWKKRFDIK